jgi:diguanylate cyclase (GGDEF)-like protein
MGSLLTGDRRLRASVLSGHEDIRPDLIALAIEGIGPMVALSGSCLVVATAAAAVVNGDRWLWFMAFAALVIGGLRFATVTVFSLRIRKNKPINAAFWAPVFSTLTIMLGSEMGLLTIYNFRFHGESMKVLCIMGTFTLCSGISSRLGLHPRVSQLSIVIMNGCLAVALASSPILFIRGISFLCVITAFVYCVSIHNQHKIIEEQVRSRRRLRNLANHDWLTGLPNRHSFETLFDQVCASGASFTLWMLDLDGFKEVNDAHGHAVGDELLKQVAQRLENVIRAEDMLARLGGDEFVVLQTQAHSRNSTRKLAERLEAEIGAPYFIDGHRITISASVGIKVSASGEQNPQDALLEADRALYRVKGTGHGGFEFA